MEMTPQRGAWTTGYLLEVFGREPAELAAITEQAGAAGLPDIAVTADVGRLLSLLASTTPGRLAVEVGTLAGYSAAWIVRGLAPGGRLVTIERDPAHARFAEARLREIGAADRVEVRVGPSREVIAALRDELAPDSVDLVFLDAAKVEYLDDWTGLRPLLAPGGVVVADNVLGAMWWHEDEPAHPERVAMDRFNRAVADDPELEVAAVPLRSGVLIGRRRAPARDASRSTA